MTDDLHTRVLDALFRAIDEVNSILPNDLKIERSPSLVLHGEDSTFESIAFINFLIAGEEQLARTFGSAPQLTVLLETADPERYRTLEQLARLTAETLEATS